MPKKGKTITMADMDRKTPPKARYVLDIDPPPPARRRLDEATGKHYYSLTEEHWAVIEKMAAVGCTSEEIAGFIQVPRRQLVEGFHKEEFLRRTSIKWAASKYAVRQRQLDAALSGQPVPQIWFGKQHLGQADKRELSGVGGAPLLGAANDALARLSDLLASLAARRQRAQGQVESSPDSPPASPMADLPQGGVALLGTGVQDQGGTQQDPPAASPTGGEPGEGVSS